MISKCDKNCAYGSISPKFLTTKSGGIYGKAVATGSRDPYNDTLESIKKLKSEQKYAEHNNIIVTNEEVNLYTQDQRDIVENKADEDLRRGMEIYITALGMSEDEYWNDYKIEENAKYLMHIKVNEHQEKNNCIIDLTKIPLNIIDKSYQRDKIELTLDM